MEEEKKKETKECPKCHTDIPAKAVKCPNCQSDLRSWFRRHPILTVVGVLVILIIVVSASSGNKTTNNTTNTSTPVVNTDTNTSTPTSADLTPKVGDVTKLGDREFVVNSVRRSSGFNYNTPDKGKEFVIVNVTIRNLGSDEISYNPFDFKVQDANGAQESETFATLDDDLRSGTLAPGGKVTGSMPFEVPTGDQATLIFQPSFWSSQRIVVDLGTK